MIRPLLLALAISFAAGEKLRLEAIYSEAGLTGPSLRSLKFSPDNKFATYLLSRPEDKKRYDLWVYHLESEERSLLVNSDDLLGSETIHSIDPAGIISYQLDKAGKALLLPSGGDLFHYDLKKKKIRRLTNTKAFELDAKFSPNGKKVSFVREQNLIVLDLSSREETALTTDGAGPIKNAMAEFLAQEEMGRDTGYWWAPNGQSIAYIQFDESPLTLESRNGIHGAKSKIIDHPYPCPGEGNVTLKLGFVSLKDQKTTWLDLGKESDFYLPRVQWGKDASQLTYQWQSRDQQLLELRSFDPKSGTTKLLIRETSKTWINLHDDLYFLEDGSLIWASERTGFKHLYHYKEGQITPLTKGEWQVDKVVSIDEEDESLYFNGWIHSPREKHLYRIPLDGSASEDPEAVIKITKKGGWHDITFSNDSAFYLDHYSNSKQPPQVSLHSADGRLRGFLLKNDVNEDHPLHKYHSDFVPAAYGTLPAADRTPLHYRFFRPAQKAPAAGYPAIIYLYGGPHLGQQARNAWSENILWAQYLAQQGYAFFSIDNRGTPRRGKKFEDPIYRKLGSVELQDQLTGINWFKQQRWIDPKRVGIQGHSYGGYITLMAMFRLQTAFKVGVSGAPLTDFRLYNTHYTERYLSHPQKNPEGYRLSSVFPYTRGLMGDLLIYHGMADDKVHFDNTTKLIRQLQEEGKLFEFMAYPSERHRISNPNATLHLRKTIADFYQRKL